MLKIMIISRNMHSKAKVQVYGKKDGVCNRPKMVHGALFQRTAYVGRNFIR